MVSLVATTTSGVGVARDLQVRRLRAAFPGLGQAGSERTERVELRAVWQ